MSGVAKTPDTTAAQAVTKMTADQAIAQLRGNESKYTKTLTDAIQKNVCTIVMAVVLFPLTLVALLFAKVTDMVRNAYNNQSHKAFLQAERSLVDLRMATAIGKVVPMNAAAETEMAATQQAYKASLESFVAIVLAQAKTSKWDDVKIFADALAARAEKDAGVTDPAKAKALAADIQAQFMRAMIDGFVAGHGVKVTPKEIKDFVAQFKKLSVDEQASMEEAIVAGLHKKLASKDAETGKVVAKEIDAQVKSHKDPKVFEHETERFVEKTKAEKQQKASEFRGLVGFAWDAKASKRVVAEDSRIGIARKAVETAQKVVDDIDEVPEKLPVGTIAAMKNMKLADGKLTSEDDNALDLIAKLDAESTKYVTKHVRLQDAKNTVKELTKKAHEVLAEVSKLDRLLGNEDAVERAVRKDLHDRGALLQRVKEGPDAVASRAAQKAQKEIDDMHVRVDELDADITFVANLRDTVAHIATLRSGFNDAAEFDHAHGNALAEEIQQLGDEHALRIVWAPLYKAMNHGADANDAAMVHYGQTNLCQDRVLPRVAALLKAEVTTIERARAKLDREVAAKETAAARAA